MKTKILATLLLAAAAYGQDAEFANRTYTHKKHALRFTVPGDDIQVRVEGFRHGWGSATIAELDGPIGGVLVAYESNVTAEHHANWRENETRRIDGVTEYRRVSEKKTKLGLQREHVEIFRGTTFHMSSFYFARGKTNLEFQLWATDTKVAAAAESIFASVKFDEDPDELWRQAARLMNEKKYAEAEAVYTRFLAAKPHADGGWYNRNLARYYQGRHADAVADLNEAIRIAPRTGLYRLSRGYARQALKEYATAIEDFRKAIDLDPSLEEQAKRQIEECERFNGQR